MQVPDSIITVDSNLPLYTLIQAGNSKCDKAPQKWKVLTMYVNDSESVQGDASTRLHHNC